FLIAAFATRARADIYQWEYINPADPSQGKQQSKTLVPDGAGIVAVPGSDLSNRNLTMAYLIGADLSGANFSASMFGDTLLVDADLSNANLTNASFYGATLRDAEFAGAEVQGADFSKSNYFGPGPGGFEIFREIGTGISPAQLYATANYQA